MNGSRLLLPLLGVSLLAIGAGFYGGEKAKAPAPVARVNVSALGKQIEVVGDLGEPLKKLLTLRGEMVAADHFADRIRNRNKHVPEVERFVRVRQVDDRTLATPVVIELRNNWYRDKKPEPGTSVELIGYANLVYEGESPIDKQWDEDPRNRHEMPSPAYLGAARVVVEGHYDDQFVVLQFDELPAGE